MIKFITEDRKEKITFQDVGDDQFFIDEDGDLCQKINCSGYNTIATSLGRPYGCHTNVEGDFKIKKILPHVTNIEF